MRTVSGDVLTGHISILPSIDRVHLIHRVNGRLSEMLLGEGDIIEVLDGEEYKVITIKELLADNSAKEDRTYKLGYFYGDSLYQGEKARVTIDHNTTTDLESANRRGVIQDLFKAVSEGMASPEQATATLKRLDSKEAIFGPLW